MSRVRSLVAVILMMGITATAVFTAPPPPVEAQESPGFVPNPPTIIPPIPTSAYVTVAGAGTVGATTYATGSATAACAAVTAGSCLVAAGVIGTTFIASFQGTTWALNKYWPRKTAKPSTSLGSAAFIGRARNCNEYQNTIFRNGYNTNVPNEFPAVSMCIVLSWADGVLACNSWCGVSVPGGYGGGWQAVDEVWSLTSDWIRRAGSTWTRTASGGPKFGGSVVLAAYPQGTWTPERHACVAQYIYCGIDTGTMVNIYHCSAGDCTTVLTVPLFPEVATAGMQMRYESRMECRTRGDSQSTPARGVEQQHGAWHFESEDPDYRPAIPQCVQPLVPRRLIVRVKFLDGTAASEPFIDLWYPPEMDEIPDVCRGPAIDCRPRTETDQETGTERCTIGGVGVATKWCTTDRTATEWDPERTRTGTDVRPPPRVDPDAPPRAKPPEDPDEKCQTGCVPPGVGPERNPDPDTSKCLPSGWGLLNPIDWVLKPVKCALVWAFQPTMSLQARLVQVQTAMSGSGIGTVTGVVTRVQDEVGGAVPPGSGPGGDGGGACQGPRIDIFGRSYYPFRSCDQPIRQWADFFRSLVRAASIVLGLVVIYNSIVRPFGVAPLSLADSASREKK